MGINAIQWGKEGWHFIHTIALTYPFNPTENDKKNYLQFLKSLENVLPCNICAKHFKKNMIKIPPRLDSTIEFFNWSVDMHNEVNIMNNKPILTYEEAYNELVNTFNKKLISNDFTKPNTLLKRIKKIKKII
jgi:hypothetical protein